MYLGKSEGACAVKKIFSSIFRTSIVVFNGVTTHIVTETKYHPEGIRAGKPLSRWQKTVRETK